MLHEKLLHKYLILGKCELAIDVDKQTPPDLLRQRDLGDGRRGYLATCQWATWAITATST